MINPLIWSSLNTDEIPSTGIVQHWRKLSTEVGQTLMQTLNGVVQTLMQTFNWSSSDTDANLQLE